MNMPTMSMPSMSSMSSKMAGMAGADFKSKLSFMSTTSSTSGEDKVKRFGHACQSVWVAGSMFGAPHATVTGAAQCNMCWERM